MHAYGMGFLSVPFGFWVPSLCTFPSAVLFSLGFLSLLHPSVFFFVVVPVAVFFSLFLGLSSLCSSGSSSLCSSLFAFGLFP